MKEKQFKQEIGGIYRLKVPFESVYTSVFLIKTEKGNALVDCATYASDVDDYILPAMQNLGLRITDIAYLILTHSHGDHAGGKTRLLELAPKIEIVQSMQALALNGLIVYDMKGHTLDCIGVLDEKTGTLLSGDGLQGHGIGKYGCTLESQMEYLQTLERIKKDELIQNILFSHAYEPWYQDTAFGREEVLNKIQDCENFIKKEIEK